jgi:TolB-like protein/Tfp pilus assembly protein PilF
MSNVLGRLRERRVIQWAVAYLAGAWLFLEALGFVADRFGWPPSLVRGAIIVAAVGLPALLILAWYHGAKADQHVRGRELLALAALFAIAAVSVALWAPTRGPSSPDLADQTLLTADRPSLAVLPFTTRAPAEDEEALIFSAGLHDDLITQLSKIGTLKVISRTSVMRYRDTALGLPEIARELGVATVMEGGVDRVGGRVRVNVQLIDAQNDEHLWAETYDEHLTAANIFAIRSDLALEVARALRATLTPDVEERIEARPTEILEAYDVYARAHFLGTKGSTIREDLERAVDLYKQAIELDPDFAQAHAGLAHAYLNLHGRGYLSAAESLPQAEAAATRALELDETVADAHLALGGYLGTAVRSDEAEREYLRAIELGPGDARAHAEYSGLLLTLKRFDESVTAARRAIELDPLSTAGRRNLVAKLLFTRSYRDAISEAETLLELEPDNADALYFMGVSQALIGEYESGLTRLRRAIELNPDDPYYPPALAYIHAAAGQREEALQILAQSGTLGTPEMPLKEVALVYGALGELDRAFEYLDRAFETERSSLVYIDADPTADALRADPRFEAFLEKLARE